MFPTVGGTPEVSSLATGSGPVPTGRRLSSVPTAAPTNFRLVKTLDAKRATFAWDPVDNNTLRGEFLGYKVRSAAVRLVLTAQLPSWMECKAY